MNRTRLRAATIALGLVAAGAVQGQPEIFEELLAEHVPPVWFGAAALGDADRDGDFDLILTGSRRPFDDAAPYAAYFRNDGETQVVIDNPDGSVTELPAVDFVVPQRASGGSGVVPVWQSAAAWGDYDHDGDLDLAVSGLDDQGRPRLELYRWADFGEPLRLHFDLDGLYAGDLAWGDLDNDGDPDLAACGFGEDGTPHLIVYRNQVLEGSTFRVNALELDGVARCTLEWGDYDADQDMDLLVTGITDPQAFVTRIYDNTGGTLSLSDHDLPGLLFSSAAWGDYDADGDLDILLSGARLAPLLLEGKLHVLRYRGGSYVNVDDLINGSFLNEPTLGRYYGGAGWGDLNNNGYFDFFIAGAKTPRSTESIQIYESNRGAQFTKSANERFDGGLFGGGAWADIDQDLDLDLLHWGVDPGGGAELLMLRNTILYGKRVPNAPSSTSSSVSGSSVTLSWSGATDRQTPSTSLTYNLYVAGGPSNDVIVTPMANLETGNRYVARRGNAGHNASWTLHDLEAGTYRWRVQALDTTFTGSEFTSEGTFTIE